MRLRTIGPDGIPSKFIFVYLRSRKNYKKILKKSYSFFDYNNFCNILPPPTQKNEIFVSAQGPAFLYSGNIMIYYHIRVSASYTIKNHVFFYNVIIVIIISPGKN